ncbi:ung-1, partial [Pristionchus pacificus]
RESAIVGGERSMASPKIPEMFLKALKRKQSSTVASAISIDAKMATAEKRPKKEEEPENEKPEKSSGESVREAESVAVEPPVENLIDLYSLVRDAEWKTALEAEFKKPYIANIEKELEKERKAGKTVYPPRDEIFAALNITPLSKVRVVLIGQDPYHNVDQAHGLCFSVKRGVKPPPSLKNIYKELATDMEGFKAPDHGFLESWARQGILMLNASLTVRAHEANSHSKFGWYTLTDKIISIVSKETEGVVFLLWGGFAHKKESLVDTKKHTIVKTAHPSPLSARHFMGCKCFSQVNAHLKGYGKEPINWGDL